EVLEDQTVSGPAGRLSHGGCDTSRCVCVLRVAVQEDKPSLHAADGGTVGEGGTRHRWPHLPVGRTAPASRCALAAQVSGHLGDLPVQLGGPSLAGVGAQWLVLAHWHTRAGWLD